MIHMILHLLLTLTNQSPLSRSTILLMSKQTTNYDPSFPHFCQLAPLVILTDRNHGNRCCNLSIIVPGHDFFLISFYICLRLSSVKVTEKQTQPPPLFMDLLQNLRGLHFSQALPFLLVSWKLLHPAERPIDKREWSHYLLGGCNDKQIWGEHGVLWETSLQVKSPKAIWLVDWLLKVPVNAFFLSWMMTTATAARQILLFVATAMKAPVIHRYYS